jgi:hypothetical protein
MHGMKDAFSVISSNNFGNVEVRNAGGQGTHFSLLNLHSVCLLIMIDIS